MTPGSAFFKTSLLNMLENDGIEFKIVQSDKLTKKTKQLSNLQNKFIYVIIDDFDILF